MLMTHLSFLQLEICLRSHRSRGSSTSIRLLQMGEHQSSSGSMQRISLDSSARIDWQANQRTKATLRCKITRARILSARRLLSKELEKKLDVFNLTYIRRSAEIEAKKKKEQEPGTWWGSVSNWWSGSKAKDDPGCPCPLPDMR